MRIILKTATLITLLTLAGCTIIPEAPVLISPEDGEVFDTIPPTFVWNSVSHSEGYLLEVLCDGGVVIFGDVCIYQYLGDTTYTPTIEVFMQYQGNNYDWHVASFWVEGTDTQYVRSEWRSFHVDIPVEIPFNLDTTYFPLGLGYEWRIKRHEWGFDNYVDYIEYDNIFEFTVKVVDVFKADGDFYFVLENTPEWNPEWLNRTGFKDFRDTVLITGDSKIEVAIWNQGAMLDFIPGTISDPFSTEYTGDTLVIDDWYYNGQGDMTTRTKRLKGIGTVIQHHDYIWYGSQGALIMDDQRDTLLYFYNGFDTVYKAPDWEG